jgi:hypothetical protein
MTAIRPIDLENVRGVDARQYPLNPVCAHPECSEPTADPHHAFARSAITNDSWFVRLVFEDKERAITTIPQGLKLEAVAHSWGEDFHAVLPHVTGLCRRHHDQVETHEAWIKLEAGEFVWYDREDPDLPRPPRDEVDAPAHVWKLVGALDPQPGGRDKAKKKRKKRAGVARRQRKTITLRVPNDAEEEGAGILDDGLEELEAKINPEEDDRRPPYFTIMDAVNYTLLNAGPEDFVGE